MVCKLLGSVNIHTISTSRTYEKNTNSLYGVVKLFIAQSEGLGQ
jgi:hypothetical protein